jgi:Cupredoxin-like domain
MRPANLIFLFGCATMALGALAAARAQDAVPEIKVQDGRFAPSQLTVPANTAFKLRVTNADKAAIEFESFELHRERVIQPAETITVNMPALTPGTYKFFDDFHSDTPEGAIVVK